MDDYGCVITACLDLYQATFDVKYANAAHEFTNQAIEDFYDAPAGTFWFTRGSGESLFARKQENDDNVMPSANAQMARSLFLLSALFGERDWRVMADRTLAGAIDRTDYWPSATHWASLLLWRTERFQEVMITGAMHEEVLLAQKELRAMYQPQLLYAGGTSENIPILINRQLEELTIFVCEDGKCQLPLSSTAEAQNALIRSAVRKTND